MSTNARTTWSKRRRATSTPARGYSVLTRRVRRSVRARRSEGVLNLRDMSGGEDGRPVWRPIPQILVQPRHAAMRSFCLHGVQREQESIRYRGGVQELLRKGPQAQL